MKFYITSFLLGLGLAMDACATSMANGLNEPKMKKNKVILIAFIFGLFQGLMPLSGYLLGHAVLEYISKFIPWIALILLTIIGSKMIYEGIKHKEEKEEIINLTFKTLIVQAFATSIDALSVGFTFSSYSLFKAILASIIIAVVTFMICVIAVNVGKRFGTKLGKNAEILGGIILVLIGIEIFITGL